MTRQDYELLADVLYRARREVPIHCLDVTEGEWTVEQVSKRIANALTLYPNFDRQRFLKACGVDQ